MTPKTSDIRARMDALWERITEADLVHADARLKSLKAAKAAKKAADAEQRADEALRTLWDDWRQVRAEMDAAAEEK